MICTHEFHECLDQRRSYFRLLNVVDDYDRECLAIEVYSSLPSTRVIRCLEHIIEQRGKPARIRVDNGPEFTSKKFLKWAEKNGIELCHIQPGKPQQNAYIERFNRTARGEWLDQNIFTSIEEAQETATKWVWTYSNVRPNMALGGMTPVMKLNQYETQPMDT